MKFTFTEKKMDSSQDLRAYAMRKIGKLDRFFKTDAEAFVTFSLERGRFLAEITIHNNGMYYRASEFTNDMYASVDSGVAAIERQIRRNKTRLEKSCVRARWRSSRLPPLPRQTRGRTRSSKSSAASAFPSSPCPPRRLSSR